MLRSCCTPALPSPLQYDIVAADAQELERLAKEAALTEARLGALEFRNLSVAVRARRASFLLCYARIGRRPAQSLRAATCSSLGAQGSARLRPPQRSTLTVQRMGASTRMAGHHHFRRLTDS